MSPETVEFARSINSHFDRLVECQRTAGSADAVRSAEAEAFAAVAFFEQIAGRQAMLALVDELRSA